MSRHRQKLQIPDLEEEFAYPEHLLKPTSIVVSPTKAARNVTVPRKRRKTVTSEYGSADTKDDTSWNAYPSPGMEIPTAYADTGTRASVDELDIFDKYFEALLLNCASFFRISKDIFVVQGWDEKKGQATVCNNLAHIRLEFIPELRT